MTSKTQPAQDDISNDAIDLFDLTKQIWNLKLLIVLFAFVFVVLAGIYTTTTRLLSKSDIYEYIIQTDFSGREKDQYPNGIPFRLSDIIAPAVLSRVYIANNVEKQGVGKGMFVAAFTVAPFSEERRFITKKYELLFDRKSARLADLQDIQRQQSLELQMASKSAVIIRLDNTEIGLAANIVEEILKRVPTEWNKYSIDTKGALKPDIPIIQPEGFNNSVIEGLNTVEAFQLIIQRMDILSQQLVRVSNLPGGNLATDADTGLNAETLKTKIRDLRIRMNAIPLRFTKSIAQDTQNPTLPINLYSPKLFDPAVLKNIDYLVSLDLLGERIQLIRENIDIILEQKYGGIAIDLESGLSAFDIQRLLDDISAFELRQLRSPILRLGISKDPQLVDFYYNSRITDLERQKSNLEGQSRNIMTSLSLYGSTGGNMVMADSSNPLVGGTVIPQFGGAFIDRLIELSEAGGDRQFRQEFSRKSVAYLQKVEAIKSEISRYKEYLAVFTEHSPGEQSQKEIQKYTKIMDEQIPVILARLREYSNVMVRISRRLRFATDMFTLVSAQGSPAKVAEDYYLGSDQHRRRDLTVFLPQLKIYAETVSRLYDKIGVEQNGKDQLLFTPRTNPQLTTTSILQKSDILFLALALFLGLFVGLIVVFVYSSTKNNVHTG